MSPDPRAMADQMLRSACDLQGNALVARERTREVFRQKETNEQNILRIAVDGLVASLAAKIDRPVSNVTEEASYQIGLSASFVRTYYVVTDMLLNGDVVEAVVLLRKQVESLARILELEDSPAQDLLNKTPNIKHVFTNGTGRIYGTLPEVAHFATPDAAELLGVNRDGERNGPNLVPQFNDSQFAYMELSHFTGIRFSHWLLGKLPSWYPGIDLEMEVRIAAHAISSALVAGVLKTIEDPRT